MSDERLTVSGERNPITLSTLITPNTLKTLKTPVFRFPISLFRFPYTQEVQNHCPVLHLLLFTSFYKFVSPLSVVSTPSLTGRTRSFEEALNVLLCLVRGELPSSTRGQVGVGPPLLP